MLRVEPALHRAASGMPQTTSRLERVACRRNRPYKLYVGFGRCAAHGKI